MMYTENYIFESTAQNKEVREACFVPSQESYNYSIEISDIANFSSSDQKSRDYNYYNQCKNSQFSNNHLYYSPEQYPPSCRKEFCDQSYPNNSKDVFSDYQKDPVNTNPISKLVILYSLWRIY
ncbi:hypothetical protein A3Q56_07646 [Intoshia linei]|uniref:Uncharacterized protein n=1 Tax=Intoshia linei TaxID=1819745 RepID=A0A177ATE6_9BILA|nr:hypothetical protein A3Q56_07646 [Intoshia linei]